MKDALSTVVGVMFLLLFSPLILWHLRPGGNATSTGSGGFANGFMLVAAICFLPFTLLTYFGIFGIYLWLS